jgi:hypothetical protein
VLEHQGNSEDELLFAPRVNPSVQNVGTPGEALPQKCDNLAIIEAARGIKRQSQTARKMTILKLDKPNRWVIIVI